MSLERKLQRNNKDQYTLTIPKALVQILSWEERQVLSFSLQKDKISVSKEKVGLTRKLQRTNKDQFILTIPKALIQLLSWEEKERLSFNLEGGCIVLSRGGDRDE